jgi:hypothetical protein
VTEVWCYPQQFCHTTTVRLKAGRFMSANQILPIQQTHVRLSKYIELFRCSNQKREVTAVRCSSRWYFPIEKLSFSTSSALTSSRLHSVIRESFRDLEFQETGHLSDFDIIVSASRQVTCRQFDEWRSNSKLLRLFASSRHTSPPGSPTNSCISPAAA